MPVTRQPLVFVPEGKRVEPEAKPAVVTTRETWSAQKKKRQSGNLTLKEGIKPWRKLTLKKINKLRKTERWACSHCTIMQNPPRHPTPLVPVFQELGKAADTAFPLHTAPFPSQAQPSEHNATRALETIVKDANSYKGYKQSGQCSFQQLSKKQGEHHKKDVLTAS